MHRAHADCARPIPPRRNWLGQYLFRALLKVRAPCRDTAAQAQNSGQLAASRQLPTPSGIHRLLPFAVEDPDPIGRTHQTQSPGDSDRNGRREYLQVFTADPGVALRADVRVEQLGNTIVSFLFPGKGFTLCPQVFLFGLDFRPFVSQFHHISLNRIPFLFKGRCLGLDVCKRGLFGLQNYSDLRKVLELGLVELLLRSFELAEAFGKLLIVELQHLAFFSQPGRFCIKLPLLPKQLPLFLLQPELVFLQRGVPNFEAARIRCWGCPCAIRSMRPCDAKRRSETGDRQSALH